jgi:hypothetical protein
MISVNPNAVRSFRKQIIGGIRSGRYALRVTGNQTDGFSLGGLRGETITTVTGTFPRQKDAVAHGIAKFNQTAVKFIGEKVKAKVAA